MKLIPTIALAALLTLVAACGSAPQTTQAEAPFRVVTHAMGETAIPAQPKRVVALDQSFVDAVLTLETPLVGYTTYRAIEGGLPTYLGPLAATYGTEAVSVGELEKPSLEQIAALKPDLILSAKVRHEAQYAQLSQIAPTVFSETTGPTWKENLRLTGQALGEEELAEAKITEYEQRAAAIGREITAKSGGTLPTVSIVRFAGEDTVRLYSEKSYAGIVLHDVGFPRPATQPTTDKIAVDVSQERILDLDADQIFVATWADPTATGPKAQFTTNPLWSRLTGAQHEIDDLTWMSAVGLQGAHTVLDDVARAFSVDPVRP
ncbi:iron complex transport system substrate-binding protein [Pseudonocardia hierapolitana]|uniref:Iron complex transport system substrate-binding protein n=1 Tax=Pseudonocardia hierapolitana TaxID=1128676 RepID=A0A561SUE7_9PSEU|nr:iron-siderophore ABC transporter substrate-binding protein [Pseudonocardia hierapolitana]TWF78482.1 iron complex transport system substrate-binding protein [Pseudonocardia hierapolitana]